MSATLDWVNGMREDRDALQAVVSQVAALDPIYQTGDPDEPYCFFCGEWQPDYRSTPRTDKHEPECLWLKAKGLTIPQ